MRDRDENERRGHEDKTECMKLKRQTDGRKKGKKRMENVNFLTASRGKCLRRPSPISRTERNGFYDSLLRGRASHRLLFRLVLAADRNGRGSDTITSLALEERLFQQGR